MKRKEKTKKEKKRSRDKECCPGLWKVRLSVKAATNPLYLDGEKNGCLSSFLEGSEGFHEVPSVPPQDVGPMLIRVGVASWSVSRTKTTASPLTLMRH